MIDLSPILALLDSLVKLSNRQLVLADAGAVAVGQIREVSVNLGRRLPQMLEALERTLHRMHERLDAMERMLQAQIRAAATMSASWMRALQAQLSGGLSIRLDSETQGLLAVQGRNLGWSLRDIVRALRPLARISLHTSQMVGQLREALGWLRRLSEQIRALHGMLNRQLNRLADILIEGFRSLRVLLWAGFTHTFAWLRQMSLQLHQILAGLRFGLGVLDSHMVAGFWFTISWLQAIFRQLRDWGMEGLFRTVAQLAGLAGMPIEQMLATWVTTLFGGVTDKIGAMVDRIVEAIEGVGEKICGCQGEGGGGGGGDEPKTIWDTLWETGEDYLKDTLWKGLGWGLKKFTPFGRFVDIGLQGLEALGIKDYIWDKTKEGAGWIWETAKDGAGWIWDTTKEHAAWVWDTTKSINNWLWDYSPISLLIDNPFADGGEDAIGGGVRQETRKHDPNYVPLIDFRNFGVGSDIPGIKVQDPKNPTITDLYKSMPRSIQEPPGAQSYLRAADRITRMQDQPLLQMARAGAGGALRSHGNLDLNQNNQIHTTVNITVPAGTPEAQVDFMSNQMRNVFQDQWNRQLRFAGDQFLDATSPASDHLVWKGE